MKIANLITPTFAAILLLLSPACKKQEDKPSTTGSAASSSGSSVAGSSSDAISKPAEVATADHITVLAHHKVTKPSDPVRINFETFRVVKADFDPQKVEGGKATLEIDLSSFHTDSDERDEHLKSPAYLDVGKLATATVTIDHVKQKAGNVYSADATVAAHGINKTYPVEFEVIERKNDGIQIKAEHAFARLDFGIGSDPAQNPEEQVAPDVKIEMVLTISKT